MQNSKRNSNGNAPENLNDNMFFGLQLDDEQKHFRDCIWDKDNIITICNARSGTGKSTIAIATGILLVEYGRYDGIVYIVSPTMEQKQGFIPGDPNDKNFPYRQPLDDALLTLGYNPDQIIKGDNIQAIKEGKAYIEFMSHTYLRGCNLEHKVVILDEIQNAYFDETKKMLTRIHDTSKVVVIGHLGQMDIIKHPERSGFKSYIHAFEKIKDDPRVAVCHLTKNYRGWLSNFCDDVEFEE
jgi:predicted ribonuclease YlaK